MSDSKTPPTDSQMRTFQMQWNAGDRKELLDYQRGYSDGYERGIEDSIKIYEKAFECNWEISGTLDQIRALALKPNAS